MRRSNAGVERRAEPLPAAAPMDVLLVEDDDGDALLVEDLLTISGAPFVLRRAQTLAAAAAMLPDGFDCVLLDLALPDAEGLEALQRLQERGEAPAIIVLTGLGRRAPRRAAVANGAQDYLVKGQVDGGLLARSIRYAVERRRAEQTPAAAPGRGCARPRTPAWSAGCWRRRSWTRRHSAWRRTTSRAAAVPCWAAISTTRCSAPTARCRP